MDIGGRHWEVRTRVELISGLSLVSIAVLCFVPPIPLGKSYHLFADERPLSGIPNCVNVLSNIPFMIAGILGLVWLLFKSNRSSFTVRSERLPYLVFFAGVALTGFGSTWYHLSPGNSRLPWDLLPMTCCFMSMAAAQIVERINVKAGLAMLIPMLVLGLASVAYWYLTQLHGLGDYRFYLYIQFFPPILIATIVALFPPRYTHTNYLMAAFFLFVAAKLFEVFDGQIYSLTRVLSGHSLKHVTAAVACYWILLMLQRRSPFTGGLL
jgi:hypothetical protein